MRRVQDSHTYPKFYAHLSDHKNGLDSSAESSHPAGFPEGCLWPVLPVMPLDNKICATQFDQINPPYSEQVHKVKCHYNSMRIVLPNDKLIKPSHINYNYSGS